VKTRFTYLADTVIEIVVTNGVDGDSVQWNVLPPAPDTVAPLEVPACAPVAAPYIGAAAAGPLLAAPLSEPVVAAPPPSKKKRALMGGIRTVKTLAFTVGGEALVYVTNNLAGLNLPPGLGIVVGAAAYGVQKAIKPDGLL